MPHNLSPHPRITASPPTHLARHYNSDLSLWLSVDPMSDKYPGVSPYVYCANNPVRLVDPNGREIDEWSFNVVTGECKKVSDRGGNAVSIYHFVDPLGVVLHSDMHKGHIEPEFIYKNVSDESRFYSSFSFIGNCSGFGGFYYKQQYKKSGPSFEEKIMGFLNELEFALRGHTDNSRWEGHGDCWDRQFGERAKPYVTSAVLLFPNVSFVNSVKTVTTGRDIYRNKADGLDYTLGAIGSVLGPFNFFRNVPEFIRHLDRLNTTVSFLYYYNKN